jgi:hypothetical protein
MTAPALPRIAHCGSCPATFPRDAAHCASCHATFADVELFAAHRRPTRTRSLCKRPGSLGLVERAHIWHLAPMAPADRLARYRAIRAQNEHES